MPGLQAAASVGQVALIEVYAERLAEKRPHRRTGAADASRHRVTASRSCTRVTRSSGCSRSGAVPVVNENDTVAVDEIRFGDNDTLAALVATMINADLVVLLSDIEGLYDADPRLSQRGDAAGAGRRTHRRSRRGGRRRG